MSETKHPILNLNGHALVDQGARDAAAQSAAAANAAAAAAAANAEEIGKLSKEKPYQQYVTDGEGKAAWKDNPLAIMKAHEDILWDGNTDGLDMMTDNRGMNMYRLDVDLSGLTAKDFVGAKLDMAVTTDGNWITTLTNDHVSSDGKSISWGTKTTTMVFVEVGGELELNGITFTPGLWVSRVDGGTNNIESILFEEVYRRLDVRYMPFGFYPTCGITYLEPENKYMLSESWEFLMDRLVDTNFVYVHVGDSMYATNMVFSEFEFDNMCFHVLVYLPERGFNDPLCLRIDANGVSDETNIG